MGYESLIYLVEVLDVRESSPEGEGPYKISTTVSMIDMCKCSSLVTLFHTPTDFMIRDQAGIWAIKDCYGDRIQEANIIDVINYLRDIVLSDSYRRYKILLGLLESLTFIDSSGVERLHPDFDSLRLVHYGY